jgi:transcriptional regulator with XRE-family HTH domain
MTALATNTGQKRGAVMEQKIRRDRNMGDNLRKLRLEKKISQEKLCAELQRRGCDIGRTTYAKYESGELNIRASVLIELRKIYNCSYDDFFEGLEKTTD